MPCKKNCLLAAFVLDHVNFNWIQTELSPEKIDEVRQKKIIIDEKRFYFKQMMSLSILNLRANVICVKKHQKHPSHTGAHFSKTEDLQRYVIMQF